jgi:antitoxin VapB
MDRLLSIQVGSIQAVTKLFLSNRSQAVRIPAHLRLPDSIKEVEVRACGQERIIEPLGHSWDSFFQADPTVPDDFLEERASQLQGERELF